MRRFLGQNGVMDLKHKFFQKIGSKAGVWLLAVLLCLGLAGCGEVGDGTSSHNTAAITRSSKQTEDIFGNKTPDKSTSDVSMPSGFDISQVPAYSGNPVVDINNSVPFFTDAQMTTEAYETYSSFDSLGRCGPAIACVGPESMPKSGRGSISNVKPTGWKQKAYDNVDQGYLYNRCHLIGYQLTGDNVYADGLNLITGTRYMNVEGMLNNEDTVADYIKETGHHVMYRVTPVFEGNNLLASGVLMEAKSVEDPGVEFCQFAYNVQPGITIDYATGDSHKTTESEKAQAGGLSGKNQNETVKPSSSGTKEQTETYILNTNTKKFHKPDCPSVKSTKAENKKEVTTTRSELISEGYEPCGRCKP